MKAKKSSPVNHLFAACLWTGVQMRLREEGGEEMAGHEDRSR